MYRKFRKKSLDNIENFSINATHWIGSINSILIHTALFMIAFLLYFMGFDFNKVLLVVTTLVSLEAIYLSIFIQMSVNRQSHRLHEVARDVEEIQEDVEEIQEDVEGIEKDVDEIQKDVEEIEESEDDTDHQVMLGRIEGTLSELIKEINELKKK